MIQKIVVTYCKVNGKVRGRVAAWCFLLGGWIIGRPVEIVLHDDGVLPHCGDYIDDPGT